MPIMSFKNQDYGIITGKIRRIELAGANSLYVEAFGDMLVGGRFGMNKRT